MELPLQANARPKTSFAYSRESPRGSQVSSTDIDARYLGKSKESEAPYRYKGGIAVPHIPCH